LAAVPRSGIRDFFEIVSSRRDIISLGIGEPDFDAPWHIREASIFALDRGATSYTSNLGMPALREEIAGYVAQSYEVSYAPSTEIIVTVGVSEALDLAIRAITDPGDEIIYHEPCYVAYAPVIQFAHGIPVPVTTTMEDGFKLTPERLAEKITTKTKAVLLNFPTNPTGATLDKDELAGIADLALEHDLVVITDDTYSELTYDERERGTIAAVPGMKERTIFLNGFSKAWAMTGFRLGFACSTPMLVEAMMKIHQYTMLCAPTLSQEAALEALRNGQEDITEMRDAYEVRRNFMCQSFKEARIPCVTPTGAFYTFPFIGNFGLTSRDFAVRLLDEYNVACVPGTAFGPSGEGYLRCAYAADLEDIKEAMARLARFAEGIG